MNNQIEQQNIEQLRQQVEGEKRKEQRLLLEKEHFANLSRERLFAFFKGKDFRVLDISPNGACLETDDIWNGYIGELVYVSFISLPISLKKPATLQWITPTLSDGKRKLGIQLKNPLDRKSVV